ncbi:MAG: hypothetical protein U0230_00035, partial [Polyangiales bacterium]
MLDGPQRIVRYEMIVVEIRARREGNRCLALVKGSVSSFEVFLILTDLPRGMQDVALSATGIRPDQVVALGLER